MTDDSSHLAVPVSEDDSSQLSLEDTGTATSNCNRVRVRTRVVDCECLNVTVFCRRTFFD